MPIEDAKLASPRFVLFFFSRRAANRASSAFVSPLHRPSPPGGGGQALLWEAQFAYQPFGDDLGSPISDH